MIRAIIFDLDGTLVDSLPDICDAADCALAEHGFPGHPPSRYRDLIGEGTRRLIERAIPDGQRHLTDTISARFRELYWERLVCKTAPYPGAAEAVAQLAAQSVPLAVLSNKIHAMTLEVTRALFRGQPFSEIHGAKDGRPPKPDPGQALAIAARLGVAPEACAFVGDTEVDIETGRRAGMVSIAVSWGYRHRSHLAGAARILDHPIEIIGLFPPHTA